MKKIILKLILTMIAIILFSLNPTNHYKNKVQAQEVEINVEINSDYGPGFEGDENTKFKQCINKKTLKKKFPVGFLYYPITISDMTCPTFTFFGNDNELCMINNIYNKISPGVVMGLMIYGIINL